MAFNYEQSIWGRGEADLSWFNPAAFRLRQAFLALQKLSTVAKVLEVGCGAGQFIRAVKRLRPELSCFGCDISAAAIAEAQRRAGGVEYAASEPSHLPYGDETFDAVLVFDVLEHAVNPAGLLAEIRRVLKAGGVFYCLAPCEGDWLALWRWLDKIGLKKGLTEKYAGHVNYFSRRQILNIFRAHDFNIARLCHSEHLIGQFLGVVAFWLMHREARASGVESLNNEEYFIKVDGRSGAARQFIRKIINFLVYLESVALSRLPSANLHIVAVKQ